jgi:putative cell wall-binding protein
MTRRLTLLLAAALISTAGYAVALTVEPHGVEQGMAEPPVLALQASGGVCSTTARVAWNTDLDTLAVQGVTVEVPGCADGEVVGLQLFTDDGNIPAGDPLLTTARAGRATFDVSELGVGIEPVTGVRVFLEGAQEGTEGDTEVGGIVIERERWGGAERIETAAIVARRAFPDGAGVVYIATSQTFPDALTGGAAAASVPGPILLTLPDRLSAVTAAEIARLAPGRVVVLGGTAAVSDAVYRELDQLGGHTMQRIGGPERVATAALTSEAHFEPGVPVVYIATAFEFPDALSGGAAAARDGGPVLLATDELPAATRAELRRLQPGRIVVLGGTAAVPAEVMAALGSYTSGPVERIAGPDRFATSAMVAATFEAPIDTVLIATGHNFPDALAGVPAAAAMGAPVLLVHQDVIPEAVVAELRRLTPGRVMILGGAAAVSPLVEQELLGLR